MILKLKGNLIIEMKQKCKFCGRKVGKIEKAVCNLDIHMRNLSE